uniref:30S ribosomal protein S11 n=1 Tax=Nephromyces sp. ex Molgula occidentalis TaxID=2544991 RepID=A0A5C1H8H3_9APIC|nr:30S ribosomal protein S11 [Nephromyces sp. ex Molgula occidentalis]
MNLNKIKKIKELNFFIISSQKNIFISLIDSKTKFLIKTYSFGNFNFKNNQRKNTQIALQTIFSTAILNIINKSYTNINIILKGTIYLKRKLILNILLLNLYKYKDLKILTIKDKTSFPFNGCKLKNKPKK